MSSIYELTRKSIDRTAFNNSVIYGGKALVDLTNMNQRADYIQKPALQTPIIRNANVTPNTRVFDEATKNVREEAAGARRVASELGRPEMVNSIFTSTMRAMSDITGKKSNYLSEVDTQNAVNEANALSEQSKINAQINNQATLFREEQQTRENALADNARSSAVNSFGTTLGQLAAIGAQKDQSIVDLLYLDKMLTTPNANGVEVNTNVVLDGRENPNDGNIYSRGYQSFGGSPVPNKPQGDPAYEVQNPTTPSTDPVTIIDNPGVNQIENNQPLNTIPNPFDDDSILAPTGAAVTPLVQPDNVTEQTVKPVKDVSSNDSIYVSPVTGIPAPVVTESTSPEQTQEVANTFDDVTGTFITENKDKKYELGEKSDADSTDCSGLVCDYIKEVGDISKYSEDKSSQGLWTQSDNKKSYNSAEEFMQDINNIPDKSIIAFSTGDTLGENRMYGIDHIGVVVRDSNGIAYIMESASTKKGFSLTPLEKRISEIPLKDVKGKGVIFTGTIKS